MGGTISLFSDGPFFLNDIQCSGSEDQLTECTEIGYGNFNCSFYVAVALCEGERVLLLVFSIAEHDVIRSSIIHGDYFNYHLQIVKYAVLKMIFDSEISCLIIPLVD